MGLDMHVFIADKESLDGKEFGFDARNEKEFNHWRKYYELDDWFIERYYAKGYEGETPNCVNLHITEEDIALLKKSIILVNSGLADAMPFIKKAEKFFEENDGSKILVYENWW